MKVERARELVAQIYEVGKKRVWIDPTKIEEVESALTKDDLRKLVERGVIKILQKEGQAGHRRRERREKKRKGRRRGPGSRKGKPSARMDRKEYWMRRIRAIRRALKTLRAKGIISRSLYRRLYRQAKGGFIRSKAHLAELLEER